MTSDEVNEAMVEACQRLDRAASYTRAEWQKELSAVEALYEQLDEKARDFVDLEPLVMMDPKLLPPP